MVVPPFSEIDMAATASVTPGAASSSAIVPVPIRPLTGTCAFTGPLSTTTTVSSGSSVVSPVTDTAILRLVTPAAKVRVPAGTAV